MKNKSWSFSRKRLEKALFYLKGSLALCKTASSYKKLLSNEDYNFYKDRVDYYCKIDSEFVTSSLSTSLKTFKRKGSYAYFLDLMKILKHFDSSYKFDYIFGDVVDVPETPTFVKSRPINNENKNSVLLKLNSVRHFLFYDDKRPFSSKKPMAVFRGMVYRPHRRDFVEKYHNSSLADVGHNDLKKKQDPGFKGFLSIEEQLEYKYIISIEGNDVATNLKWIMGSNSVCFMRKPRYETWFMEGTLVPGVHYVELADDFSDLEEKINYYNENESEAINIIRNANMYTKQFFDMEAEKKIGLLVAEKYFDYSVK